MKTLNSEQLLQARTEEIYNICMHPEHLNFFKLASTNWLLIKELETNIYSFELLPEKIYTGILSNIPGGSALYNLNGETLFNAIKQRVAKIPGDMVITIDKGLNILYIEEQKIESHILLGFGAEQISQLNMILSWERE